jgi:hypothetical protein
VNHGRKKRLPKLHVERRWPNRIKWPEKFVRLFGKISDRELAKRSGFSLAATCEERRRRAIAPFKPASPKYDWTAEMIALLGTDSDGEVGARLRRPRTAVQRKRASLGIPAYVASGVGHDWTPREIALLGKHSDRMIADLLGLCGPTVSLKRQALGIPPYETKPAPIRWTKKMLALLGKVTDEEVARRYGIPFRRVAAKRRELDIPSHSAGTEIVVTPALLELLREPTIVVMQRTGISGNVIAELRRKHGIVAASYYERRWSPAVVARLGKVPDMEIARELGVHPSQVAKKRKSLGIPAGRPSRRWLPHELALLEKLPDEAVAERLGRSVEAVETQRLRLTRPARQEKGQLKLSRRWLPHELALLGKLPDEVVARKLGRSVRAVETQRQRLGRGKSARP